MTFTELADIIVKRDKELIDQYQCSSIYGTTEGMIAFLSARIEDALNAILDIAKAMGDKELVK